MIVEVGIAHPAPVEVKRVVEERAVPLGRGLQLPDELGEQRDVECVDLGHLRDLVGVVPVVGERMVRIGDADLGIGPRAGLPGELECDDPGDVPLERQDLEVEHQASVVGVGCRDAHGPVEVRQGVVLRVGLGLLDPALDLANGLQVLADLGAIRRAELLVQARHLLGDRVEEAGPLLQGSPSVGGASPSPKRRSKTIRGWASDGSGVVGELHERLF